MAKQFTLTPQTHLPAGEALPWPADGPGLQPIRHVRHSSPLQVCRKTHIMHLSMGTWQEKALFACDMRCTPYYRCCGRIVSVIRAKHCRSTLTLNEKDGRPRLLQNVSYDKPEMLQKLHCSAFPSQNRASNPGSSTSTDSPAANASAHHNGSCRLVKWKLSLLDDPPGQSLRSDRHRPAAEQPWYRWTLGAGPDSCRSPSRCLSSAVTAYRALQARLR